LDLGVGQGVGKGRHLLAAVEDLVSNVGGGPESVIAQIGKVRPFFAACSAGAMAVCATLIAKQDSPGFFSGLGFGGGVCGGRG
jgi:hypothetical protein